MKLICGINFAQGEGSQTSLLKINQFPKTFNVGIFMRQFSTIAPINQNIFSCPHPAIYEEINSARLKTNNNKFLH